MVDELKKIRYFAFLIIVKTANPTKVVDL